MNHYTYKKVDAFTSDTSLGNPAAYIELNENQSLSPEQMLLIASLHKGFVCEMVFCQKSEVADLHLTSV